jgi:hypothetical protein
VKIREEIAQLLRKKKPTLVERINTQTYQVEFGKIGYVVSAKDYQWAKEQSKEKK